MEAVVKPVRRRWPLGWLTILGLAIGIGFWSSVWLWRFHEHFYYSEYWFLLLPTLWLLLAGLGLLSLLLVLINLLRRQGWRAIGWLLLASFAAGNCLIGVIPLAVSLGLGTTAEVPKED
jgi:hypothetical protein